MFDLAGKVAIVTGGSRGIGRAVSIALAGAGAHVLVNYRSNEEAAKETLRRIEEAGGTGEILGFDVSDPESVDAAIKDAARRLGHIDILVNNAGISIDQLLLRVSAKDLEMTWATNVNGALFCAKAAIRSMMRSKWGRIISLSSVVAESGNAGQVVYSASKAALLGMTRSLAREFGPENIRVNALAPGWVLTPKQKELWADPDSLAAHLERQCLKEHLVEQDIVDATLFLASKASRMMTGQTMAVDGGVVVSG